MQVVDRLRAGDRARQQRFVAVAVVIALYASLMALGVEHSYQGQAVGAGSSGGTSAAGLSDATTDAAASDTQSTAVPGEGDAAGPASGSGATSGAGAASGKAARGATAAKAAASGAGAQAAVTATEIKIGVITSSKNNSSVIGNLGLKGQSIGDTEAEAKVAIDLVNAAGGIAGRKIVPVFKSNDINSGTYSGQAQSNCSAFTEDVKVFAVVGAGVDIPGLSTCLARSHIPIIPTPWVIGALGLMDHKQMDSYGGLLKWSNQLDPDNYKAMIDRLVAKGFFTPSTRIGLLRSDSEATRRISDQIIKPALAAHGMKLTSEAASTPNDSVSGVGEPASQVASAVLRFRTDLVDRVLFLGGTSSGPFFFMPQAESQGYRPRYFVTSWDMPYFLSANVPKPQLANSIGIGWETGLDVDSGHEPPPNPTKARCLDAMKKAGQAIPDPDVEGYMTGYCDAFQLLRAAFAGTRDITPEAFASGVDRLGASFEPAQTFSVRFGPGRHAGVSSYRDLVFDNGCGCYTYGAPVDTG